MSAGASNPLGGLVGLDDRAHAMSRLLAQNWWAVALRGVFAIIFGLIALFVPGATILTLVLFFSAYMVVDGVFGIVSAVRAARQHERWGLLVLEGVADIAIGVIAFLWPGLTAVAFVFMIGVWSLVTGILELVAAFKLNPAFGRGWLIFGGIVSILFGIALLMAPVLGLVVLTWWIGAYALIFGIAFIVLAFKLKAHKDEPAPPPAAAARALDPQRASLSSGDQVGSEAKDGVGTGCSTRPVMSTMYSLPPDWPPGSRKNMMYWPFGAQVGPSLWKPSVRMRSPEPSGFMMPMAKPPARRLVKAM